MDNSYKCKFFLNTVISTLVNKAQKQYFWSTKLYRMTGRKPITEEGFNREPLGQEYFDYARNVIGSLINDVELKWYPGQTGLSMDDFVIDASIYAIEMTREDYKKGLLRNEDEKSFKKFFWHRIKKSFFKKLDELGKDPRQGVFDERLGKYYEGTAVDFGPMDENDEELILPVSGQEEEHEEKRKVSHRTPKKDNDVVYYYYSPEKADVLEESHQTKMWYVQKILDIVSRMSPGDQRLFKLKYQLDFSREDYRMWKTIGDQKHVKDPFTKMAHEKYGISENYARKRICEIMADIRSTMSKAGHTEASYRQNTSVPVMLQSLQNAPQTAPFDLDIDSLSEADCREILIELSY